MNADLFITVVFVAIAVLVALTALLVVVPSLRRDDARRREDGVGTP